MDTVSNDTAYEVDYCICGHRPTTIITGDYSYPDSVRIACSNCHYSTDEYSTLREAISEWNEAMRNITVAKGVAR